ncbi:Transcription factor EMB1444-like protein [Drosera capensis]
MATPVQQLLRHLCLNSEWNYAVFWKLKHHARMVLTWEDAYYNNHAKHDALDSKCLGEALEGLHDGQFPHDPLGLAVAKMSYHVYSFGEGVIGQVAVTGEHQWIFADDQTPNTCSSFEHGDGWHTQFLAGIKTIVVVAVLPHAVVSLGSLNKISEDRQLVIHIRELFSAFQDFSACNVSKVETAPSAGVSFDGENDHLRASSNTPQLINQQKHMDTAKDKHEMQPEFGSLGNVTSSFEYKSAGYELHEALGSASLKDCNPWWWELEDSGAGTSSEMPMGADCSMLTSDLGSDHLLEAVIGNFCCNDDTVKSGTSLSTSSDSLLTTEKTPAASTTSDIVASAFYSADCLNSESFSFRSMDANSSLNPAAWKDHLMRPIESTKAYKKRAKPGESNRPRPRDRQLIQDRIKELRELVPNGSKCSIDSLLERTIKHMLFLHGVTKHADKLTNNANSRVCKKEVGVPGCSSYEQGSSWVVEVGGEMKVGPIVVENLNVGGQLLIEMLCEDCDHFLEIAEAMRSSGLNILKGSTDNHGDKTWMHFIVEAQNNRSLHRMDVLWSLVQILQAKAAV